MNVKEANNKKKLNIIGNRVVFTPCVKFLYLIRNSSKAILETAGNTAAAGEKKQLVHTAKAINTIKNFLKSTRSNTPQITVSNDKIIIILWLKLTDMPSVQKVFDLSLYTNRQHQYRTNWIFKNIFVNVASFISIKENHHI